ncbi:hypothetical protein K1719_009236 [Acacia pycnantha]|nr:hypothetical protein K1719_009236 [Acacia pycnantha]
MSGNYTWFATCFQIPEGYESEHGTPIVGSTTAFQLFAITALVSFCFSITCLAAFLAMCSPRNDQYRHYRRSKLHVGFFSLFVSINISMLISFCAAHVLELNPKHTSLGLSLCTFLCNINPTLLGSSRRYSCTCPILLGILRGATRSRRRTKLKDEPGFRLSKRKIQIINNKEEEAYRSRETASTTL